MLFHPSVDDSVSCNFRVSPCSGDVDDVTVADTIATGATAHFAALNLHVWTALFPFRKLPKRALVAMPVIRCRCPDCGQEVGIVRGPRPFADAANLSRCRSSRQVTARSALRLQPAAGLLLTAWRAHITVHERPSGSTCRVRLLPCNTKVTTVACDLLDVIPPVRPWCSYALPLESLGWESSCLVRSWCWQQPLFQH